MYLPGILLSRLGPRGHSGNGVLHGGSNHDDRFIDSKRAWRSVFSHQKRGALPLRQRLFHNKGAGHLRVVGICEDIAIVEIVSRKEPIGACSRRFLSDKIKAGGESKR